MLGARLFFLPVCLLQVVILFEGSSAGGAEDKAVVAGALTASPRAGAGVDQALKATLIEGEREHFEEESYQVTATDGQTGFINTSFLKVGSEAPEVAQKAGKNGVEKPTRKSISMVAAAPQSGVGSASTTHNQRPTAKAPPAAAEKSPSILQMLEGHENEIVIAAAVAAAFFFVGWICGGNYYLRRDRKRRNKIRF
jgi:hypothetical protein